MTKLTDKLQLLAQKLSDDEQKTLLDYAEFLVARSTHQEEPVSQVPLDIPRPAQESVVEAMRRLSNTYVMLNMDKLLHEASGLMSEHIMHGRGAEDVIDELQALFDRHYQDFLNTSSSENI